MSASKRPGCRSLRGCLHSLWNADFPAFDVKAVCDYGPLATEMLETQKVITIDDGDLVTVHPQGLDWFNKFLVLGQARSRGVISKTETVHDKVVVVRVV